MARPCHSSGGTSWRSCSPDSGRGVYSARRHPKETLCDRRAQLLSLIAPSIIGHFIPRLALAQTISRSKVDNSFLYWSSPTPQLNSFNPLSRHAYMHSAAVTKPGEILLLSN